MKHTGNDTPTLIAFIRQFGVNTIKRDNRINAIEYAILKFMSHCLFDPTIDQMMSMSREIKTLNITRGEVKRGLAHLVVLGWIKHTRNCKYPNDPKPSHGFMYLHSEERRQAVEKFESYI